MEAVDVEEAVAVSMASRRRESALSTGSTDSEDARSYARRHSGGDECCSGLSDGRDSGVEADTFTPPDEETGRQIADAVEYYFSNENLLKDAFLLKHVKRNKEGFVSLKLISSFKHVKHLTRDWRAVAFSVRYSLQLELNDEGTKVRRLQSLPEYDETVTSRTVVAVNLPLENPTIATVSELFSRCGDITSIRVLKPGTNVPVEVRAAFNKRPEIIWESVNCAVVEFDRQDNARVARESMTTAIADDDESGMHILPIGKVSNKKKSRQEDPKLVAKELEAMSLAAAAAAECGGDMETQKKRRQRRKKPLVSMDSRSSMSGTDGEYSVPGSRRSTPPQGLFLPLFTQPPPLLPLPPPGIRMKRLTPPSGGPSRPAVATGIYCTDIRLTDYPTHHQHYQFQQHPHHLQHLQHVQHVPQLHHHHQHIGVYGKTQSSPNVIPQPAYPTTGRQKKSNSFSGMSQACGGSPDQCSWMQRRKASGAFEHDRRGSLVSHDNVVREPKGPDGSRGFGAARRPSRVSTTIAPTIEEVCSDGGAEVYTATTSESAATPTDTPASIQE